MIRVKTNLFFFSRKYSHFSSNDNYKEQKLIKNSKLCIKFCIKYTSFFLLLRYFVVRHYSIRLLSFWYKFFNRVCWEKTGKITNG